MVSACVLHAKPLAKNYGCVVITPGRAKMCIFMILHYNAQLLLPPYTLANKRGNTRWFKYDRDKL
jgi:hypothetical protein